MSSSVRASPFLLSLVPCYIHFLHTGTNMSFLRENDIEYIGEENGPLVDTLSCAVCYELPVMPIRVEHQSIYEDCGCVMCLSCHKEWREQSSLCPRCRRRCNATESHMDALLAKMLRGVSARCCHCGHQANREDVTLHLRDCLKRLFADLERGHDWRRTSRCCLHERPCVVRCKWAILVSNSYQSHPVETEEFLVKWIQSLQMNVPDYTEIHSFRMLLIRHTDAFLALWQRVRPSAGLLEVVSVWETIAAAFVDEETTALSRIINGLEGLLERSRDLLQHVLRGEAPMGGDVLKRLMDAYRVLWLNALVPLKLSMVLASTVANADVRNVPMQAIDFVVFCVEQKLGVGVDWSVQEAETFVTRAMNLSQENSLSNLMRICLEHGEVSVGAPLWKAVCVAIHGYHWPSPLHTSSMCPNRAICEMHRQPDLLDTMWVKYTESEMDSMTDRGIVNQLLWAAVNLNNVEDVVAFTGLYLRRGMQRENIVALPPSVACVLPLDDLTLIYIAKSLELIPHFVHRHNDLPVSWMLSWMGYAILFIRLGGQLGDIESLCPQLPRYASSCMDVAVQERTWSGIPSGDSTPMRNRMILLGLLVMDPVDVSARAIEEALAWLVRQPMPSLPRNVALDALSRALPLLSDNALMQPATLRFLLQWKSVVGLKTRLSRVWPEAWSMENFSVLLELANEEIRDSMVWMYLFSPWVSVAVQQMAVEFPSNQRNDRLWKAILRIHAVLPGNEGALRCNGKFGALLRLCCMDRSLADLGDALSALVGEDNQWARRWEMASRPMTPTMDRATREDNRLQPWILVQGVIMDRLRRFAQATFTSTGQSTSVSNGGRPLPLPAAAVNLLVRMMAFKEGLCTSNAMWLLVRWAEMKWLNVGAAGFWSTLQETAAGPLTFIDTGAEAYGDLLPMLKSRLLTECVVMDGGHEDIHAMYILLALYMSHPQADNHQPETIHLQFHHRLPDHCIMALLHRMVALHRIASVARLITSDTTDRIFNLWMHSVEHEDGLGLLGGTTEWIQENIGTLGDEVQQLVLHLVFRTMVTLVLRSTRLQLPTPGIDSDIAECVAHIAYLVTHFQGKTDSRYGSIMWRVLSLVCSDHYLRLDPELVRVPRPLI